MSGKPLWRQAFDRTERTVGRPLERLVTTRRFNDALVVTVRLQGALVGAFERQTRTVLHFWNMPARSDVRRLSRQVATLTGEVRTLSARLDEQQQRRRPRPAPKTPARDGDRAARRARTRP